ncbi:MAG: methylated-DNA--[protein]-cysteine S-methyltransferase [Betaproteobacteria bacterium]|nr:methylated-DNA--[protein]-cysteine S-methyltransferase [Betaproteobacteria bacterium]
MSNLGFDAVIAFPAMHVGVRTDAGVLAEIAYLPKSLATLAPVTRLAERAARQLEKYIDDPDAPFSLPLARVGSPFQRRVWAAISAIPRGEVLTYGRIAKALRSAPRAVGQACGSNWFPLVIPCHRVVGANGLGGFAHHGEGFHIEIKRWLLEHERAL